MYGGGYMGMEKSKVGKKGGGGGGWLFFFSSRRRHTRLVRDWSSDVCSSDLLYNRALGLVQGYEPLEFQMVNGDMDVIPVAMVEVDERLDEVLAEVREIMGGKPVDFCYGDRKSVV